MGLFDKKYCDVCGEKIGLLGNRKLEDGNLCKDCAKKLSPWFSERRHATVGEIKEQLAYREENRKRAAQFRATCAYGQGWRVLLDEEHRWFTVTRSRDLAEANPDILDFSALTGCRMDVDEDRTELMRKGKDGKEESYTPPRYEYSYDFYIVITVNHPYFDEMRFRLNDRTVELQPPAAAPHSLASRTPTAASRPVNPETSVEYRQYRQMGEEICNHLKQIREAKGDFAAGDRPGETVAEVRAAPQAGPWVCPACGGTNTGSVCEYCDSPRP